MYVWLLKQNLVVKMAKPVERRISNPKVAGSILSQYYSEFFFKDMFFFWFVARIFILILNSDELLYIIRCQLANLIKFITWRKTLFSSSMLMSSVCLLLDGKFCFHQVCRWVAFVCMFVCLFVCLAVLTITQKVLDGFIPNFHRRLNPETTRSG